MSERVRDDGLGDPGAARDLADDPAGAVPVQPPPFRCQEHRPACALGDGQVDRPGGPRRQRDGDDLAALAGDRQRPVPAFQAQVLDVGAGWFGDPQPVQREQGDERMLGGRAEPGGDQQGAELVAVQCDGVRLVVDSRPPDVRGRGVLEEFFFDCVPVEPGDGAQPPGDRGPGAASGLELAGEALDVGAADASRVSPPYPARNPASASRSVSLNTGWMGTRVVVVAVIGYLPVRAEAGGGWARRGLSEI
jgi:hypothetical protein